MRTAARFTVQALLAASVLAGPAHAGLPYPVAHSLPKRVLVVGTDASGTPDPLGRFQVEVRSLAGEPWPNGLVVVAFDNTPDVDMCSTQPTNEAQYTGCYPTGAATSAFTNAQGIATLTIVGHADRSEPDAGVPSLRIYCDGITMGTVPVAALDQDGGGVGASDLSLLLQDLFANQYLERSDLDGDGTLGAADLSLLLSAYFAGRSAQNLGTTCP